MNKHIINKKFLSFIFVAFISAITLIFTGLFSIVYADSSNSISANHFLPTSSVELRQLTEPLGCYYWGDNYSIINKNGTSLLVYDGQTEEYSEYSSITPLTSFNLKQVNVLTDRQILVNNDGILRYFSIDDSSQIHELKYNDATISGNYFDACDNYLVVSFNNRATCYTKENGTLTSSVEISNIVDADKPIKINDNGDVFFIGTDSAFYRTDATATNTEKISDTIIDNFICNNDYLYYLSANSLYRLNLSNDALTQISFPETSSLYDLGYLTNPSNISFKGENLLFTDGDTIQEFEIKNNKLNFTGFAICKNKTAYNRISSSVKEVEKVGDFVAVLDDKKITKINGSKENDFINYTDLLNSSSKAPISFALGDNTILLNYSDDTFKLINSKNQSKNYEVDNVTYDICYQHGKYYIISRDIHNRFYIHTIDETTEEFTEIVTEKSLDDINNVKICVDVFSNIYIATGKSISKCGADNYYKDTILAENTTGLIKMQTDLNGNLYALYDGNKIVSYNNETSTEYLINVNPLDGGSTQITSFALDYVDNSIYFIFNGEEYIYKTNNLGNSAIFNMDLLSANVTTGENADIQSLKFYSINDNFNSYKITFNQSSFEYSGLFESENLQFVLINEIALQSTKYLLLTSNISLEFGEEINVTILVNKIGTTQLNLVEDSELSKAYVATTVNMYYLPLITRDNTYCLTKNSENVTLSKETEFEINKVFSIAGKPFYYAMVNLNGEEITGYIPVNFTTEVLSDKITNPTFTYAKVYATKVYSDGNLETEIYSLQDDAKVKLLKVENGICKILFSDGTTEIEGYIKLASVKTNPNTTIRNVLIIGIILTCVTVTSLYFIIKKNKKLKNN